MIAIFKSSPLQPLCGGCQLGFINQSCVHFQQHSHNSEKNIPDVLKTQWRKCRLKIYWVILQSRNGGWEEPVYNQTIISETGVSNIL